MTEVSARPHAERFRQSLSVDAIAAGTHPESAQATSPACKIAADSTAASPLLSQHSHSASVESASLAPQSTFPRDLPYPDVDPLSQEIWNRTAKDASRISHTSETLSRPPTGGLNEESPRSPDGNVAGKEASKRKGVSFLARLIKKKEHDDVRDDTSPTDCRPEGADAQAFHEPLDYVGYSPEYPPPPAYIKVRSANKLVREFDRVFLSQELQSYHGAQAKASERAQAQNHSAAIWSMEFSKDGRYLAAAGQDRLLCVWAVLADPEDRRAHQDRGPDSASGLASPRLSAPVFRQKPHQTFQGHTGPILDLSWSKNNFVLSSSMDKTVRLWHVSQKECLCAFKHHDVVTSVEFHPKDDRFFLAGSLDSRLRLWSIPDKTVAYHVSVSDIITAVAFTPDGRTAIAGSLSGNCTLFDTDGLKLQTQIHVKSSRGKNARGSKITGIQTICVPAGASSDVKMLVTSNDSRIRLYNLRDKSLEAKFKGNENTSSQIHARFSDDGQHVICGSEDKRVFVWSTKPSESENGRNKWPVEVFEPSAHVSTACLIAPTRTRILLGQSDDPVYDICNPPPVHLLSRAEEESLYARTANDADSLHRIASIAESYRKVKESPSYQLRSKHANGNIILTSDSRGSIKVFRQDCAADKRQNEPWDSSPSLPKRVGSSIIRRASLVTDRTGRSRQNSLKSQAHSERILSWRQSINSNFSFDRPSASSVRSMTNRDPSPRQKQTRQWSRQSSVINSPALDGSDEASIRKTSIDTTSSIGGAPGAASNLRGQMRRDNSTTSSLYYRRDAWKDEIVDQLTQAHSQMGEPADPRKRYTSSSRATSSASLQNLVMLESRISRISGLSALSSNNASPNVPSPSGETEELDQHSRRSSAMPKCRRCGGLDFKHRVRPGISSRGKQQLSCTRCGLLAG